MKNYHYKNFSDITKLQELKSRKNLTVGVGLPLKNEIATIGKTIDVIKSCGSLIDQVVCIDSQSTDGSFELCQKKGIEVILDSEAAVKLNQSFLPGKGWNLWASLGYLKTDIVIWVDTDIKNFNRNYILGLIGPLLVDENIQFVKGCWWRKKNAARVTEILVRPFFNLFFSRLAGFVQPLSGEYGGRTKYLRSLFFTTGYGVEVAILVQSLSLKPSEVAQTFLGARYHNHQSPQDLGKMSVKILRTMLYFAKKSKSIDYTKLNNQYKTFLLTDTGDFEFNINNTEEAILPPHD